jgi:hypothetical protein
MIRKAGRTRACLRANGCDSSNRKSLDRKHDHGLELRILNLLIVPELSLALSAHFRELCTAVDGVKDERIAQTPRN